jgi:hypothetical protein
VVALRDGFEIPNRTTGQRLAALTLAAGVLAAGADGARSALFFFFDPTTARPGDRVTVRTAGTPKGFTQTHRVRPLQRPMRVYVVGNAIAGEVRSRFDSRLHFVGSLRPDREGRGILTFAVPPLESGSYAAAVWCPGCARSSRGRTFFVLTPLGSGHRARMLLRVAALPATADRCPVTIPNGDQPPGLAQRPWHHGNGALWTVLREDGVYRSPNADGSQFVKMIWGAAGVAGPLSVRYQRLDAAATAISAETVRGTWHGFRGSASWASRMHFSEGCWRVTGRVRDVSLSFVLEVVRAAGA